jgi:hypothetical protein
MDQIDPHLEILLQEFVRLCPEDIPLEPDNWTGLHEICVFIHEHAIQCSASTFRDVLIHHGCSEHKATAVSRHYRQCLHQLKGGDHGPQASVQQRDDAPTENGPDGHALTTGAADASISV